MLQVLDGFVEFLFPDQRVDDLGVLAIGYSTLLPEEGHLPPRQLGRPAFSPSYAET